MNCDKCDSDRVMEDEIFEHESYGLLQISRQTCNSPVTFFGSSIKCSSIISVRLFRAEKHRHLNRFWYHPRETLFEIEMTPNQFAELITTLNAGVGSPVTIKRIGRDEMGECPHESIRELFEDEFEKQVNKINEVVKTLTNEAEYILNEKGGIKVKDKQRLKSLIEEINREIFANTPYMQTSFNKSMDKTVAEAKTEVDSFVGNMIIKLGKEQLDLKQNFKFLPGSKEEEK